jgi:hypothetical protein
VLAQFTRKKFLQKIKCGYRFEKGFSAKIKLLGGFERRHLGKDDTIVVNLKRASRHRRNYRSGFERKHLGTEETIVVDLKKDISAQKKLS